MDKVEISQRYVGLVSDMWWCTDHDRGLSCTVPSFSRGSGYCGKSVFGNKERSDMYA